MKVLRKSIEHLRAEPDASLGELYVRYAHWLKARVSRQYGCEDAEDLVQEAWLRLTPSGVASVVRHPKALLLKIVSNVAIDRAKRRKLAHAAECEMARHMVWGGQPEAQSNQIVLSQTILGLPQPLRDVFVLSRFGGLTNVEIGERLGISPKTVEWRMTKALAHCAAQLRR